VLQTTGVGKITGKRTSQPHHTPSFTYSVYNRQALALLAQIQPYLRTYKAKRSRLILRDYLAVTPRNGRYSEKMKLAREQFEVEVLSIKA
jgi:hypothetical protein